MSATDVPTKERSPEQPSSLPPERRCGEKRPREEETVRHQGTKMKASRLTVPLERTGNDHNPDLHYGEDERIASVADVQMADSPTSDDQPSGVQEDHASEPNDDTDNAANLNESDLESIKSVWRSRVQEHKVAKQMNRYIIDVARKEVRSGLRHPETRFNGRYEDGSTFTLSDGAPQYPSREEISASAFLPTLTAQESASLEVAKRPVFIGETRLPDTRSVEDEHIFVAPAKEDELNSTTCSLAPSTSQGIVSPDSISPDVSIQSSTVPANGKICRAHDHQQQALDVEPASTRQDNFLTDPIESRKQAEQGTVPDSESDVQFASIDPFCQTRSEVEL
ncbi:uncharacterized protein M437DRAFT_89138 [Aureobasidium melanogenum CBS 110374]|uniref:Uncharacterized protein n=1 Tax=Aureobasidium melanogenum (strain CBS 110374) TaxID=1043003 RepID=A0A074W5I4_AURM1|nr:uncharacterized protein M437DRAFT_89138 [Aureobasidium melanogenum CBS 110374]KEQ57841.1 hypothetical protein M437DRAFT_89138 [Aureobasidium melanogenum CBS 110374]